MCMVAVVMVMVLTTLMEIMLEVGPILVVLNHHHITNITIPIDMNHMLPGALVEMVLEMVLEVLEDVKELLLSMNTTVDK